MLPGGQHSQRVVTWDTRRIGQHLPMSLPMTPSQSPKRTTRHADRLARRTFIVCVLMNCCSSACATDWLQFDFDASHSGNNAAETTQSATGTGSFALSTLFPLWSVPLAAKADGAPVFLANVATA